MQWKIFCCKVEGTTTASILGSGVQVHDVFSGEVSSQGNEDLCRQDLQPTSINLLKLTGVLSILGQTTKPPWTRA